MPGLQTLPLPLGGGGGAGRGVPCATVTAADAKFSSARVRGVLFLLFAWKVTTKVLRCYIQTNNRLITLFQRGLKKPSSNVTQTTGGPSLWSHRAK